MDISLRRRLSRRALLRGLAGAAATAALPGAARAQDFWADFHRGQVLRGVDQVGNTEAAMLSLETVEPILSYDTAYNLGQAVAHYERLVAAGGWEALPREAFNVKLGAESDGVRALKRRLAASGDLGADAPMGPLFDPALDAAVRRFQARHGLAVDGHVGEASFLALMIPAAERLDQLRLNLLRVENMAGTLGDRYAVVNIPAASIEAVEMGAVARRHTAIVGRIDRQTPILESRIHEINFNPYWHVPRSIVERDLIPFMNEDPEYLTRYNIRIYDGSGREVMPHEIDWTTSEPLNYMFRQDPGVENSMGHVKINFHNPHAVYLHDTPSRDLFAGAARFHSSGCVRVEDVEHFVAWVLRDNGGWDTGMVEAMFRSGERRDVPVAAPVPIHTTYITAWANRQGIVSFRDDVYEYDRQQVASFT